MSKELLLVVDAVAAEKGVPESVILEAIEAALASAAKKRYIDQDVLVRVQIDAKDGSYETFRRWEVVADDVVMESPDRQVRLMDALDESDEVEVGDYIEEQIDNPVFGRIAAQAAKLVIVQRVREAERQQVANQLRSTGAADGEQIRAAADRQREVTLANAYREAQKVKGDGDAEAARIYAESFGKDPAFAQFYRSLEAYKASFSQKSDVVVMDLSSDFFKAMRSSNVGGSGK